MRKSIKLEKSVWNSVISHISQQLSQLKLLNVRGKRVCRMKIFIYLLITWAVIGQGKAESEAADSSISERFCYPDAHKNTRKSCECSNISTPPWGLHAMNIDCSFKDLKNNDLNDILPLYVERLDLSWNGLEKVPSFASDSLHLLNLMHNNISSVAKKNFIKLTNLRELYLNWNSIQVIEANAFEGLAHLQVLDLSHNNLQALNFQLFAPMLILETLSLSWNRQLNQTQGIQEQDFYSTLGVTTNLKTLNLDACSLTTINLSESAKLKELSLKRNHLKEIPSNLPKSLEKLDISQNLFFAMMNEDMANFSRLEELRMEDMPNLEAIEENAFVPLKSLKMVSFQNSRNLGFIHGLAFGEKVPQDLALETMIFRGTTLRYINSTLAPVFAKLQTLDLNGVPLQCDCELVWIKNIKVETNGRCYKPSRLRGMLVTNVRASDFSCDRWPRWLYGCIVLLLIILTALGIYLIVIGLKPNRKVCMRPKVGVGSPYARVTIEPNRQEHL